MAYIESTLLVRRPPEEVFAFLNAAENHARFIPNMTAFEQTSPGVFGRTGATAHGVLRYLRFIKINVQYEMIEHELDHRLAMKGKMGPVLFKDGYILNRNGRNTEIKFWLDLSPTGWTRILSPFMGLVGRFHAYETLRNLKRELMREIASSPLRSSSQPRQ